MITTHIIPILQDNYAYVITTEAGDVAVIDPGEARPIERFLKEEDLQPHYIFLTHYHGDHIAGTTELKEKYGAQVIGPSAEADYIPDLDIGVHEGHPLQLGEAEINTIETPGHTFGMINYFFPQSKTLFSGDTLFLMGCGRVFEGTMEEMYQSLQKLKKLPPKTKVFCGHEYTLANAEFAQSIEPDNKKLAERAAIMEDLREKGYPSVPGTLADELRTNPFLRAETAEEFAQIRYQKDRR